MKQSCPSLSNGDGEAFCTRERAQDVSSFVLPSDSRFSCSSVGYLSHSGITYYIAHVVVTISCIHYRKPLTKVRRPVSFLSLSASLLVAPDRAPVR